MTTHGPTPDCPECGSPAIRVPPWWFCSKIGCVMYDCGMDDNEVAWPDDTEPLQDAADADAATEHADRKRGRS